MPPKEISVSPEHKEGMKVPKGGSSCANCSYLKEKGVCGNERWIDWNKGVAQIPEPDDEYCCDHWESQEGELENSDIGTELSDGTIVDKTMVKSEGKQGRWYRSKDGLRIPAKDNPARIKWDKDYLGSIKNTFGGHRKYVHKMLPVDKVFGSHMPSPGNPRIAFYTKLYRIGEKVPPVVVSEQPMGGIYDIMDGNHRLHAAKEAGVTHVHAVIVRDATRPMKKSEPMMKPAFRHVDSGETRVPDTGFHDTSMLPGAVGNANVDIDLVTHSGGPWEDGFVDHEGTFYNRDEAQQAIKKPGVYAPAEFPGGLESQDYKRRQARGLVKSESWVKHPELPPRIQRIFDAVRSNLTPDLLKPEYQGNPNPMHGHCYVATESLFHLLDGKNTGWQQMHLATPEGPHWFLRHKATGTVIDPTAEQFVERPDYEKGKSKGFTVGPPDYDPTKPSKRAQVLIDRVSQSLSKSEDEFEDLAKTVGYIKFPKLGVTDVQEPMTYPEKTLKGKKGRDIFSVKYQLGNSLAGGSPEEGKELRAEARQDVFDKMKERGGGWMTQPRSFHGPLPSSRKVTTGFVMGGKRHGHVGTVAHEAQHSVFGQLAQKYGQDTARNKLSGLVDSLTPEGRKLGKDIMGVNGYSLYQHGPEEFITAHQQFLIDPVSRNSIFERMGIKDVDQQRAMYKLMRQNFEKMRAVAAKMKPLTGMVKSENLQKSIKSIAPGKVLAHNPLTNESLHDYSHVLPKPLQAEGWKLRVKHEPRTETIIAHAFDPQGNHAGNVGGYHHIEGGEPTFGVESSFVHPNHRGKGLGTALYEATYAFSNRNLGVNKVVGSDHSPDAVRIHQKLAAKHGMDYSPEQMRGDRGGEYEYVIKAEVSPKAPYIGTDTLQKGDDQRERRFLKKNEGPYIWDILVI